MLFELKNGTIVLRSLLSFMSKVFRGLGNVILRFSSEGDIEIVDGGKVYNLGKDRELPFEEALKISKKLEGWLLNNIKERALQPFHINFIDGKVLNKDFALSFSNSVSDFEVGERGGILIGFITGDTPDYVVELGNPEEVLNIDLVVGKLKGIIKWRRRRTRSKLLWVIKKV